MALAKVEKIQILAHASLKMSLLSSLQEAGIVQLKETNREEIGLDFSFADISHLDHLLHRLKHGLNFLSHLGKKGILDRIIAQKPVLSRQEREELLKFPYLAVLEEIEKVEAAKNEVLSRIRFIEKENEFLLPLANLDLPISFFGSKNILEVMLGTLPLSQKEAFVEMSEENAIWHEIVSHQKRACVLLLFFLKKDKDVFEERIKEFQFSPVYLAEPIIAKARESDRIVNIIEKNRQELNEKAKEIERIDREAENLIAHQDKLAQIHDILYNERGKISSSSLFGKTERVVYLEGWVCAADVKRLKAVLEPYTEGCEVYVSPPLPGEDPPVILENPRLAKPFEVVTSLYGLPSRDSVDPTIPLAPFFFIFVGLCVSEAGYGFVVTLLSLFYMKFAKPKGSVRLFMKLLFLLGISNIILGTLVGGWFGFPIRQLLIIDPLKNPLSFLALSLILGFIQVWFGTLLNLINELKKKNYLMSIFVQGGWLLLLPSLSAYLLTKQKLWGIMTLAGASGIVFFASPKRNFIARFFGGLYSLYDISKYLGDILSYSRLLALGLSTTVIAMVVNTLCQTALGIPWIGWLFAVLIFIGGHLFNLAISFLGGFVHSMRLQFVEFFTKFFQAGGKPFKPFRLESKFVEFI